MLDNDIPRVSALNSSLPVDLDSLMDRALERHLDRRYPTALDLADELGRARRGDLLHARPASTFYRVSKFVRRHRSALLVAALTVVVLALGGGMAFFGLHRASLANDGHERVNRSNSMLLALADAREGRTHGAQRRLEEAGPLRQAWEGRFLRQLLRGPDQTHSVADLSQTRINVSRPFAVSPRGDYVAMHSIEPRAIILLNRSTGTTVSYPGDSFAGCLSFDETGDRLGFYTRGKLRLCRVRERRQSLGRGRCQKRRVTFCRAVRRSSSRTSRRPLSTSTRRRMEPSCERSMVELSTSQFLAAEASGGVRGINGIGPWKSDGFDLISQLSWDLGRMAPRPRWAELRRPAPERRFLDRGARLRGRRGLPPPHSRQGQHLSRRLALGEPR